MSLYPDRRSAVLPALAAAQRGARLALAPRRWSQVAAVMQRDPRLPRVGRELLRHARAEAGGPQHDLRVHEPLLPAARRARAAGRAGRGDRRARRRLQPGRQFHLRAFECLGACDIAPMASIEGHYRGPLDAEDAHTIAEHLRAGGAPGDVLPEKRLRRVAHEGRDVTGILLKHADVPDLHRIETYERLGGYRGLRRALTEMTPDQVLKELEASGLRGRGGAGFSMGKKASFLPARRHREVPVLQRRRVRAGHVQGPRADAPQPAPADRGHPDRRLRRRHQPRLHLHPRRVRGAGRHPRRRGHRGVRARLRRRAHPGSDFSCASSCTAAPARTSAARRRRCSTRSRASAATRA